MRVDRLLLVAGRRDGMAPLEHLGILPAAGSLKGAGERTIIECPSWLPPCAGHGSDAVVIEQGARFEATVQAQAMVAGLLMAFVEPWQFEVAEAAIQRFWAQDPSDGEFRRQAERLISELKLSQVARPLYPWGTREHGRVPTEWV